MSYEYESTQSIKKNQYVFYNSLPTLVFDYHILFRVINKKILLQKKYDYYCSKICIERVCMIMWLNN